MMKARPVARRAGEGKQAIDITEDFVREKQLVVGPRMIFFGGEAGCGKSSGVA